ncbi:MAG TPA: STAS domain-containing protein [Actinopolymorphaceae bacterium]
MRMEQARREVPLTVRYRMLRPGLGLVALAGDLTQESAPRLRDALPGFVASTPRLAFDVEQVTFLDTNGLTLLVAARRQAFEHGGDVQVIGPRPMVRKILQITALDQLFPIRDSLNDVI